MLSHINVEKKWLLYESREDACNYLYYLMSVLNYKLQMLLNYHEVTFQ